MTADSPTPRVIDVTTHDHFAAALGRFVEARLADHAVTVSRDIDIFKAGYRAGYEYGQS